MSRVLVYQANGVQGAATVRRVQQAGFITRALVRNGAKAAGFLDRDVEVAIADLTDRDALIRAHDSVDYVVLQIPAYADDFATLAISNAAHAMESARVRGAVIKMANPTTSLQAPNSGFSINEIVLERLRKGTTPFSVVEPTMYLDTFLKPNLRHEIAAQNLVDLPIRGTLKIAWTTVDDAARLAARVLQLQCWGQTFRCAGEIDCDGPGLAAKFSAVLGRPISYRNSSLDDFQRDLESALGVIVAAPVVSKFRFLDRFPEEARRMFAAGSIEEVLPEGFVRTRLEDWIYAHRTEFSVSD